MAIKANNSTRDSRPCLAVTARRPSKSHCPTLLISRVAKIKRLCSRLQFKECKEVRCLESGVTFEENHHQVMSLPTSRTQLGPVLPEKVLHLWDTISTRHQAVLKAQFIQVIKEEIVSTRLLKTILDSVNQCVSAPTTATDFIDGQYSKINDKK
jgi:hypothetical protein